MKAVLISTLAVLLLACSGTKEKGKSTRNAEFYYGLAVNFYYDQKAQAAIRELEHCFALDPKHVLAHNLSGLIHMGRKEFVDSQAHFEKALELDPDQHMARANLGALFIAMQKWQAAIDTMTPLLHEALYGTPDLAENNIGWAYYNLGQLQEAEIHLKRALFLNDKLCLAYNNLGVLHLSQKRWQDARDDLEAAVTRCPNYIEAHFRLGSLLEQQGVQKDADKHFEKCRKIGGESIFGRRCKQKLQVQR